MNCVQYLKIISEQIATCITRVPVKNSCSAKNAVDSSYYESCKTIFW